MIRIAAAAVASLILVTAAGPGSAQSQQSQAKSGCSQAPVEPATQPSKGEGSGTSPGSSGSTGWSGAGLGGAFNGTSPSGPVSSSPSWHPVTAKGLDPIKGLPQAQRTSC